MVDVPSAINQFAPVVNTKLFVAVAVPTHKISVEVFSKTGIPIILFPQTNGIRFTDFHRITGVKGIGLYVCLYRFRKVFQNKHFQKVLVVLLCNALSCLCIKKTTGCVYFSLADAHGRWL